MGVMITTSLRCGHPSCGTKMFRSQSVWDAKEFGRSGMVCQNGHPMTSMKYTQRISYREGKR